MYDHTKTENVIAIYLRAYRHYQERIKPDQNEFGVCIMCSSEIECFDCKAIRELTEIIDKLESGKLTIAEVAECPF